MKSFLKLTLALALLLVTQIGLAAQDRGRGGDPAERAEKRAAQLAEKLELNEAQTVEVEAIILDTAEKTKAAREANQGDREAMKTALTALKEEHLAAMESTLTPEQFTTYQEMAQNRTKKMKKRRKNKRNE